jgi:hypothetical protein
MLDERYRERNPRNMNVLNMLRESVCLAAFDRGEVSRKDIERLMEQAEDRAPDGDMPPGSIVSNDDLSDDVLSEAGAGSGDYDDDIPEHLWEAEGVDTLGEYTRRASESIEDAIDRLPDDPEDSEGP